MSKIIKSYLGIKKSNKDVYYLNLDEYENDKEIISHIKEKFGYAEGTNAKLLLKLFGDRKCPQNFRDSKEIKLAINNKSGIVFLENENKKAVVLNNAEDRLIEIEND